MHVLGIETSCDETAAAVVASDGRVLSDIVHSQVALHAPLGGVVPELAARDHLCNVSLVVREALAESRIALRDVGAIAVTNRPGLVGALLVGVEFAKGLAFAAEKPLVGVDHLLGHILAVFLKREGESEPVPSFPFVALLVSGGHKALYRVDGPRSDVCHELGATRDDAAGEAFDKVAKMFGLGYPGGPVIDRLAEQGDAARFPFSAPMKSTHTLEFSFSGLKTQVAAFLEEHGPLKESDVQHAAASFQRAVTDVLSKKLVAAALREDVPRVVLGGGVAANRELRERTLLLASAKGLSVFLPPLRSCTDNAAMIAYAGAMRIAQGEQDDWSLAASGQTALRRVTRKGRGSRA